jgi:glycerophosphoryl diester phosphodiesterase
VNHLSTVLDAYRQSWARRGIFVPVYLVLRLLSLALIAPGFAVLVNLAVSLSDQSALTDQDIAMFLFSPPGALAGIGVISVLLVAEVLGISVMTAVLRQDSDDRGTGIRTALGAVAGRLGHLLIFAVLVVLRVLALALPFLAVAAVVLLWALGDYDINYYLTYKPPSFVIAAAIAGAIGLVMVVVVVLRLSSWAQALHLVLFEGRHPMRAFADSAGRMTGRRRRLQIGLLLWLGLRLLIAAALATIAGLVFDAIPITAGDGLRRALLLSLAVMVAWSLAGLVLAAIALGALAVLLDGFFDGRRLAPVTAAAAPAGLRGWLVGAVALAAVAFGTGAWLSDRALAAVGASDEVTVIGHRGAAGSRPENTMASVLEAIAEGADYVEIDVQETADGELLVIHDSDFMKLAGVDLKVWNATMDDIAGIDIGSWFDAAYESERAPTLREVLSAAKGKAKVLIELKYYGHDQQLEDRTIAIVEELGMADQVAVMSLKYPAVQKMQALRPDWRSGVLAATAVGDMGGLKADFLAVSSGMATLKNIRAVQASGKDFYVWTVNDPLDMSRMISMGVDGLITDHPALVHEVLAVRAAMGPTERLLLWAADAFGVDLDAGSYRDDSP